MIAGITMTGCYQFESMLNTSSVVFGGRVDEGLASNAKRCDAMNSAHD